MNIKDYPNYFVTPEGKVQNMLTGNDLSPAINPQTGYLMVSLWKDNVGKTFAVHRLVALAYLPNPLGKPEVNHIDSDRTNCHPSNLEWVTSSENSIHAVKQGRRDHIPRMKSSDLARALNLMLEGNSYQTISDTLNNAWKVSFLSVKVKQYAIAQGKLPELQQALQDQRKTLAMKNLGKINVHK